MTQQNQSNEQKWRENGGQLFTTGANIEAVKIDNQWRWVVVGFDDATYFDGKSLTVSVSEPAKDKLVTTPAEQLSLYGTESEAFFELFLGKNLMQFATYEEYKQYVNDEWAFGAINELEADGFIKVDATTRDKATGRITRVSQRQLTAEEFNFVRAEYSNSRCLEPSAAELVRYERRTLDMVNRLIKKHGAQPLEKLKCGARYKAGICPIANSLDEFAASYQGDVEPESNHIKIEVNRDSLDIFCNDKFIEKIGLNPDCKKFIKFFDEGLYPHLIDTFENFESEDESIPF